MKTPLPSTLSDSVKDYVQSGEVNDIPVAYKDDMVEKKPAPKIEKETPAETEKPVAEEEPVAMKKATPLVHKIEDPAPAIQEYEISPEAKAYRDSHLLELLEHDLGSLKQQSFFFTTTEIAAIRLLTSKLKCKKRYVTMRLLIRYALDNMLPGFLESDEVTALASELKEEYDDTQQKRTRSIL